MSQVEEKKETDNEASAAKAESKNYQSVDNVDFSSKSAIMNSPRSEWTLLRCTIFLSRSSRSATQT